MEETATSDEQMVERALSGDPEAFGEIVRRWERRIFALTFGMLGREEDARDATQETFFAAFRNLRGFRGEAKVSSWLHRIAVNQCITRQRRAKVRNETALEDEAEKNAAVFALPLDVSPARTVENRERSAAVRRAVCALPTDLRQVVGLKTWLLIFMAKQVQRTRAILPATCNGAMPVEPSSRFSSRYTSP